MALTALFAVLCIVLAFIGEILDEKVLLGTLEWLVAAVAFALLDTPFSLGGRK